MSRADRLGKRVRCPFYLTSDGQTAISCEGPTDECRSVMQFISSSAYRDWRHETCEKKCENCPVYRGLMLTKYDI